MTNIAAFGGAPASAGARPNPWLPLSLQQLKDQMKRTYQRHRWNGSVCTRCGMKKRQWVYVKPNSVFGKNTRTINLYRRPGEHEFASDRVPPCVT